MSSAVNYATGEIIDTASPEDARRLTDRIKVGIEGVWHLIEEAYTTRAWAALGYKSWDDYCTREFGTSRLRLPRENRPEVVASLRESGLSVRAIVAATGTGIGTVHRALAGVPFGTPDHDEQLNQIDTPAPTNSQDEEASTASKSHGGPDEYGAKNDSAPRPAITGIDGKTYPAKPKYPAKPQRRSPLPDEAMRATYKLRKKAESIERIFADDRLAQNKEQISLLSRSDLLYVQRVVAAALEQLPIVEG